MVETSLEQLQSQVEWMQTALYAMSPPIAPKTKKLVESFAAILDGSRPIVMSKLCIEPEAKATNEDENSKNVWDSENWDVVKANLVRELFPKLPAFMGKRLKDIVKKKRHNEFDLQWENVPALVKGTDPNYRALEDLLNRRAGSIERMILVQHWGQSSDGLRDYILTRNQITKIELYVQEPEKACCERQKIKVHDDFLESLKSLPAAEHERLKDRLTVYVYDVPASIRAVLVDDKLVAVGWYMYHPADNEKGVDIWGSKLPTIYAEGGSESFTILNSMVQQWLTAVKNKRREVYPNPQEPDPPSKADRAQPLVPTPPVKVTIPKRDAQIRSESARRRSPRPNLRKRKRP